MPLSCGCWCNLLKKRDTGSIKSNCYNKNKNRKQVEIACGDNLPESSKNTIVCEKRLMTVLDDQLVSERLTSDFDDDISLHSEALGI